MLKKIKSYLKIFPQKNFTVILFTVKFFNMLMLILHKFFQNTKEGTGVVDL